MGRWFGSRAQDEMGMEQAVSVSVYIPLLSRRTRWLIDQQSVDPNPHYHSLLQRWGGRADEKNVD